MGVKEEKARQTCFCFTKTGRQLAPVKPSRCSHIWDDLQAFSKRLTKSEHEIAALKKAADVFINSTEKTLSSALPSDYTQDADGNVHPVPGTGRPVISAGLLPRTKSLDLKDQVSDPIGRWQAEQTRLKGRMGELDRQRLRLDEARRKYFKATQKHIKENVLKQDNVTAVPQTENENPELTNARGLYQKLEAEVHEELAAHAAACPAVQGYLTKAMQLQAARLNDAAMAHSTPAATGTPTATGHTGHTGASAGHTGQTGALTAV
mmetsp:Transcript_12374/g.37254  ORF Transcript_12374/g.37254 Transcript_12374/m.37254 type:complete len:264 (-) Transcript_12374:2115-2906(-)|eukprot:CAMPEP_0206137240 /NCGR_PEP_ID=MMETSP1473-20131121/2399_1 /ASSEMBLY_ACC=CAM_ASM_001109 /TAXON_ID=1461547 /ORGANISM="Stichococcus sp, Strain RCC1054" /LENGTH=263 /DNA_ID=CAMNT_0053530231 /DNA_START=118 /DNA_END=909 /DNA_ORIENTATION=-